MILRVRVRKILPIVARRVIDPARFAHVDLAGERVIIPRRIRDGAGALAVAGGGCVAATVIDGRAVDDFPSAPALVSARRTSLCVVLAADHVGSIGSIIWTGLRNRA